MRDGRAEPSRPGRTADEIVVDDAAGLAWVINLGCIDLNPHPVRADDLDHPDELRVDLDPVPGVPWDDVRRVALVVRDALADVGLVGWPKTSGNRGIHVNVRIERRWTFPEVRRAALALARDVERRVPDLATSKWWKEERHGVFIDYNQNAKDRTVASAYSVRPRPDARVSTPLRWDEVADVDAGGVHGAHGARSASPGTATRTPGSTRRPAASTGSWSSPPATRREGLGDAPWPPNYAKTLDEPPRVQPSKRRMSTKPLIEIGRAAKQADAIAGLERWKARHPDAWPHLRPADVLVDAMRGRSTTWTRIRLNLEHVPPELRPAPGAARPRLRPVGGSRGRAAVGGHPTSSRLRDRHDRQRDQSGGRSSRKDVWRRKWSIGFDASTSSSSRFSSSSSRVGSRSGSRGSCSALAPDSGPYAVDDPSALLLFVLIPVLHRLGVIVGQVIFALAPVTSARLLLLAAGDIVWVFCAAWGLGTVAGSGRGADARLARLCADGHRRGHRRCHLMRAGDASPEVAGQGRPGGSRVGDDGGRRMNDLDAVERERLRALVDADVDRAAPFHAEDFQLVTPSGRVYSKEGYLEAIRSGDIAYTAWEAARSPSGRTGTSPSSAIPRRSRSRSTARALPGDATGIRTSTNAGAGKPSG